MTIRQFGVSVLAAAAVVVIGFAASGTKGTEPMSYGDFRADCDSRGGTVATDEQSGQYLCSKRHAVIFWAPIKEANG